MTTDDRIRQILHDERRIEADHYALFDQVQQARRELERLTRAYELSRRQLLAVRAEKERLREEEARGRLYRERGA